MCEEFKTMQTFTCVASTLIKIDLARSWIVKKTSKKLF